ncbi:IclR family transcriptional regulator C-terminal domain-containing protein [Streptomyces sp. P9(2023)]|uniref:IclR family transcriptional regulator domain-containing protein n=1 Tax=Streptomyces sp. P9(2023) TaxID=3064394 RepID=UPI0028F3E75A|nr:IclR family transcriptional regulator C-terminal domain-containing protein [Streptomyces sp. P9(2023)]MDT9687180.1 IclR family transcriptional regulator C-terminal domain-containing protein [Streptomyces sp. P9(2023)]
MPPTEIVPQEAVAPLMRGITVLRRLTDADGALSLSELERTTGLARSTVDRVTGTLARMGYVRLDGRDVFLAPRLMELGNACLAALGLPGLLGGPADALADALDESVSLAVADGDGIRFVHQATRRRAMSLSFRIGDPLPAERTAPGALFAAHWTVAEWDRWRARRAADPRNAAFPAVPPGAGPDEAEFAARAARAGERGWALDDELIEPGLVALALPVRDAVGAVVCVASVVSHTSRHTADSLRETVLPRLRAATAEWEESLRRAAATDAPPAAPAPAPGLADWTRVSKQELGRGFIESLARGLTVLTAFGEGRAALTLSGVAEATGLARATARRALITLEHLGYVAVEGRLFRLTPQVLALGFPYLSRLPLPQIAGPHLAELSRRVHDSASLAVLAGHDVRYTARVATRRIMSVHITVGTRFPAHATSLGRVMLADLPPDARAAWLADIEPRALTPYTVTSGAELAAVLERVREQGYALVDEELEQGLRSIAVPVRDRAGTVVAAVNVAMHGSRRTVEQCVGEVLPELRAAVARIEDDLRTAGRFARVPEV